MGRLRQGSGFLLIKKVLDFDLADVEILEGSKMPDGALVRFSESFYYVSSEEGQVEF